MCEGVVIPFLEYMILSEQCVPLSHSTGCGEQFPLLMYVRVCVRVFVDAHFNRHNDVESEYKNKKVRIGQKVA